jgi:hypothetical protein
MKRIMSVLAAASVLVLAGCADQLPTESPTGPELSMNAGDVVASAAGGASWILGGLDLDGDGDADPVGNVLAFNAVRYADGSVDGEIEYHQSGLGERFLFHGKVTCISVYDGNRARFGGPITRSEDPGVPVGRFMWFTVVDNGDGASGAPDRSSIFGLGTNAANEAFCANPALPNPRFSADIESGNIRVNGR